MKKKRNSLIIVISILLFCVIGNNLTFDPLVFMALVFEAFVTIHMSTFVLMPISKLFAEEDSKKLFWKLFWIRIVILLVFDLFITPGIAFLDFILVFIGIFLVVPILNVIKGKKPSGITNKITSTKAATNNDIVVCPNCRHSIIKEDKFCSYCGKEIVINNDYNVTKSNVTVKPSDFDSMYSKNEDELLELFIKEELRKANVNINTNLIPEAILKRKNKLNLIFSCLVFVYVSLIFFHFPIYTYIIGLIILFIFNKVTKKYNFIKYLKKEIKSRPNEKISNIIMNTKNTFIIDSNKTFRIICVMIAVILPMIIFINPRIFYEEVKGGYAVRFYTFGVRNFETAVIPDSYKNKPVLALRGNTFSNMPFLRKVELPNTIIEIRGQAFKNNRNLVEVNIPNKLEYLGGGSFYNCTSIISITLPDTLTYLGGESFYNAKSLKSITLSNNITEIRGSTFENCTSLEKIVIPDSVTRIGGHAFYSNTSLKEVSLTENSKLEEIGSSAFRLCDSLTKITIPKDTYVNYRVFKESPTKVLRFGEVNYGNLIDESKYKYNGFKYVYFNYDEKISYNNNSIAYQNNASIKLDSVFSKSDSNEFNITYQDDNEVVTFTLSMGSPFKEINENVAVEIADSYVFDYSNKVSLNVYFN